MVPGQHDFALRHRKAFATGDAAARSEDRFFTCDGCTPMVGSAQSVIAEVEADNTRECLDARAEHVAAMFRCATDAELVRSVLLPRLAISIPPVTFSLPGSLIVDDPSDHAVRFLLRFGLGSCCHIGRILVLGGLCLDALLLPLPLLLLELQLITLLA
jgi:hypothetical protein